MREMDVVGVRVEMPSNQPIVLLREVTGERYLPIWIGAVEATAIAFAQQGVTPPRPLTHDLMRDVLAATGQRLEEVRIVDMQDSIFYAQLVFEGGAEVGARPSDSIALALRTGTRIVVCGVGARRGRPRRPGGAGGRGRAVPRVPRPRLAGRLRGALTLGAQVSPST